tara:strand:+ start:1005 stop:1751 length:747 start_codon:yes stop_codon:yes gene_type:complete
MKKKYLIANWKMNKTLDESRDFFKFFLKKALTIPKTQIIFCPPFVGLFDVSNTLSGTEIDVGAQNVYVEESGAFTGEISTKMLKNCGCVWVILGHSERRSIFLEEEKLIRRKLENVLSSGLSPILCIGESIEERKNNYTKTVLHSQLSSALNNLPVDSIENLVIAYEPVWAIGTGMVATPKMILETNNDIKQILTKLNFDNSKIPLIYGGSVNPNNAKDLINIGNVDGFLVGGASLDPDVFYNIYNKF